MNFLEKDLETILFETDQANIRSRGLLRFNFNRIFRQVNLGGYGIADLITISEIPSPIARGDYGCGHGYTVTVYELKHKKICPAALFQAFRYLKGIQHSLKQFDLGNTHIEYRACLIGSEIDKSDFCYLPDFVDNVQMYSYKFKFDGIWFIPENCYKLTDPQFPKSLSDQIKSIGHSLIEEKFTHEKPF